MLKRVFSFIGFNWLFCLVGASFLIAIIWYLLVAEPVQANVIFGGLTALGTCSVVILSVFPIKKVDNVTGKLVKEKDRIYIKLFNNSAYTVYLGYDKILYGTKRLPIVYGHYIDESGEKKELVYPGPAQKDDNQAQAELACVSLCLAIAAKNEFTLPLDNLNGVQVKDIVLYTSNGQTIHIKI